MRNYLTLLFFCLIFVSCAKDDIVAPDFPDFIEVTQREYLGEPRIKVLIHGHSAEEVQNICYSMAGERLYCTKNVLCHTSGSFRYKKGEEVTIEVTINNVKYSKTIKLN